MKGMTITYEVGNSLYLNITNRCSNRCDFCIRQNGDGAYGSNSLWLEREPTEEEILAAVDARDVRKYDEVIFCGYGEPTERLDTLLHVAKALKAKYGCKIRVNTNGQSDLIFGRDTSSLFAGAVDTLSISLNAPNAAEYQRVCHSVYGEAAYDAILAFASHVKHYVPHVVLTVVDAALSAEEIEQCRKIAEQAGVPLRVRAYIGKDE